MTLMALHMGRILSKEQGNQDYIQHGWVVPVRLTRAQEDACRRFIGSDRYAYNAFVAAARMCLVQFDANHSQFKKSDLFPSGYDLIKAFRALKNDNAEGFDWWNEIPNWVLEGARLRYEAARRNWLDKSHPSRRPKFRSRKATGTGSFLAAWAHPIVRMDGHKRIIIPGWRKRRLGTLNLRRELPTGAEIKSVRIKYDNQRWYASLSLCVPPKAADPETQAVGGMDVGITPLAAETNGANHTIWENPKALYRHEKRLAKWQRRQARRKRGGRGWMRAAAKIAKCHRNINGIRRNALHQASRAVIRKYDRIGIESLNVRDMDKLKHQAKAVRDSAMGEMLRQIKYKSEWYGREIVLADQWYPSSKTCADCGEVNANLGREPKWTCPNCGAIHDRNINAARNLRKLALGLKQPDVTPMELGALAIGNCSDSETAGDEVGTHSQLRLPDFYG